MTSTTGSQSTQAEFDADKIQVRVVNLAPGGDFHIAWPPSEPLPSQPGEGEPDTDHVCDFIKALANGTSLWEALKPIYAAGADDAPSLDELFDGIKAFCDIAHNFLHGSKFPIRLCTEDPCVELLRSWPTDKRDGWPWR